VPAGDLLMLCEIECPDRLGGQWAVSAVAWVEAKPALSAVNAAAAKILFIIRTSIR